MFTQLIWPESLLSIKTYSNASHFINTFLSSHDFYFFTFDPNYFFFYSEAFQDAGKSSLHLVSESSPPIRSLTCCNLTSAPPPHTPPPATIPFRQLRQGHEWPPDCQSQWIYLCLSLTFLVSCLWHWLCLLFFSFGNFCLMPYHYSTTYIHYRKFRNRHMKKNPEITTSDLFVYVLSEIFL